MSLWMGGGGVCRRYRLVALALLNGSFYGKFYRWLQPRYWVLLYR